MSGTARFGSSGQAWPSTSIPVRSPFRQPGSRCNLYEDYAELRLRLGFVPQGDVLYNGVTLGETMEYAAQLRFSRDVGRAERNVQIELLLDQLGLARMTDIVVGRLSGGQQRRVAVAIELITEPSLLFLDEPTPGLDPGNGRALMKMLRELGDGGRTVIGVTHRMQSIRLCDRLLVLAPGGRLAYFGAPQLAPAFFGCDDFQDVFQMLNSDPGRDWGPLRAGHRRRPRRAGLVEPDGQNGEADFNSVNGLLGDVTSSMPREEADRFDTTLTSTVLPAIQLGPSNLQQVLSAWRSEAWRNAERLLAARTPAERVQVARSIEVGAAGRARLIESLTSDLVIGPGAARRDAYCERHRS
ncbi:MAG TPA: DUF5995 family protein [Solirubrobacteraceae bacterium]|nr:DUF5995 family protein [Solirubrobacteraceae bacterium]